jgi:hypothetical protein
MSLGEEDYQWEEVVGQIDDLDQAPPMVQAAGDVRMTDLVGYLSIAGADGPEALDMSHVLEVIGLVAGEYQTSHSQAIGALSIAAQRRTADGGTANS